MRRLTYLCLILGLLFGLALTAPASAAPLRADRGPWAPNTAYAVNDTVTYNGCTYKVIQAHTSLTGWEPPIVPALFTLVSCGTSPSNTPSRTSTPAGPTNTPSRTSTRTNTPVGPTATFTRTNTSPAPTNTPTQTVGASPTRTFTPTTVSGGSCSGVPQYVAGTTYVVGQIVQNINNRYSCTIGGWCSSSAAWAYAPGTGSAWTDAWALVGPCNTMPTATSTVGPTPTPCSNCGGGLPKHVITGYWQNFNNGATVLRLSNVPAAYNLIAVAFADASGTPGAVTFNIDAGLSSALGGYTNANFVSDVGTAHSKGQKVIISVGGQNGTISVNDATSATNFANSIVSLMNNFGFDGVDIDLENGINATYMAQALRSIRASKPGLIITFAPQTIDFQSSGAGYYQLAVSIKDILTINNMQYYNSGSMLGCNGSVYSQGSVDFITAQACLQLQAGLRPDQIGLGLPASPSGAGSGYVSPTIVNNALDCLAAGSNCGSYHPASPWPGIRGAMTWSINWDASNGYSWVNAISAHLGSVP